MSKTKASDRSSVELRDFVQENGQRVYDFCAFLLANDLAIEEIVLSVFRDFGEFVRRNPSQMANASPETLRLRLFQITWNQIQNSMHRVVFATLGGRDTRVLKGLDDDILPGRSNESREKIATKAENRVRDRLARVDAELRAPLVLRDVLKFTDEDAAKILGLRWGVYRHRLHRGRLDFKDALRGVSNAFVSGKAVSVNA